MIETISSFFVDAFGNKNMMLWLVPLWPLMAFAFISLFTLADWVVRQIFGLKSNTIPANSPHYHDSNHGDYGSVEVPYQSDWVRVGAVVVGMSGAIAALITAWFLVFGALNQFGAGTFGLADSAVTHSEEAVAGETVHGEAEAVEPCAPCIYADSVAWMSLGNADTNTSDFNIGVLMDPLTSIMLFMVPIAVLLSLLIVLAIWQMMRVRRNSSR